MKGSEDISLHLLSSFHIVLEAYVCSLSSPHIRMYKAYQEGSDYSLSSMYDKRDRGTFQTHIQGLKTAKIT